MRDLETPFLEAVALVLDFFAVARLAGAALADPFLAAEADDVERFAVPFFEAVVVFEAAEVERLRVVLRFLAVEAVGVLAVAM